MHNLEEFIAAGKFTKILSQVYQDLEDNYESEWETSAGIFRIHTYSGEQHPWYIISSPIHNTKYVDMNIAIGDFVGDMFMEVQE